MLIPEQINTPPDSLCCEPLLPTGTLRLAGELTPTLLKTLIREIKGYLSPRIWLVAGITDIRNGFNGFASKAQNVLKDDPLSGHLFIFRGCRGGLKGGEWSPRL